MIINLFQLVFCFNFISKTIIVSMSVYEISSTVYLDKRDDCYKNILLIDQIPGGSLSQYVKRINLPKRSPFDMDECCPRKNCVYAIMNPEHPQEILCLGEVNMFFSFIIKEGYTVDYQLSRLMMKNPILNKHNKFVCYIKN